MGLGARRHPRRHLTTPTRRTAAGTAPPRATRTITGVSLLARALAADPGTPSRLLVALTPAADRDVRVATHLLIHPNLPDALVPSPHSIAAGGDLNAHRLASAVHSPVATDQTRTRALARVSDDTLYAYLVSDHHEPHPTAHAELARRGPLPSSDLISREFAIALLPGTTDTRRLQALRATVDHDTLSPTLAESLLTAALRYPDQLRDLASLAHQHNLAHALDRYADRAAKGVDLLAHRRTVALDIAQSTAVRHPHEEWEAEGPRVHAITTTSDPAVASAVLDLLPMRNTAKRISYADHIRPITYAILNSHALRHTPVYRRAKLLRLTSINLPTEHFTTQDDADLAHITHAATLDAVELASRTHPLAPRAEELIAAGWARVHFGNDITSGFDTPTLAVVEARQLARFALHPALPAGHRDRAVQVARRSIALRDIPAHEDATSHHLQRILEHARTPTDLHAALLSAPLPALTEIADHDLATGVLLAHHLAQALLPLLADMTEPAARTVVALEDTFTGTAADLLTAATTVAA